MKINPIVFIIVGLLISYFANFVDARTDNQGIALFFYVGLGFIIYGVFKIAIFFVLKDKSKSKKDSKPPHKVNVNRTIISCPTCMTKHYSNSNFCHMCGTKLLK